MTPEEAARRAVACTAVGELSGLPKWEWCVGMLYTDAFQRERRILDDAGSRRFLVVSTMRFAEVIQLTNIGTGVPDFTDDPTVLAMLPLVRRQYPGHVVDVTWHPSGNVDVLIFQPGLETVFVVDDVPLYEALTLALEAAPEKQ